jgi:hypothetical protein
MLVTLLKFKLLLYSCYHHHHHTLTFLLQRKQKWRDIARTRKDMAKLFQTMEIHKDMLSYVILEFQLLRTWLVTEFCPAMRISPHAENPAPPVPEIPKYDHSSSDDSSPTMPH